MFIFKPNIEKLKRKADKKGLIKALTYEDPEIRTKATFALGDLIDVVKDKSVNLYLIQAAKDSMACVRQAAAYAMGKGFCLEGLDTINTLLLEDESAEVREAAAFALGLIKMDESSDALIKALYDSEPKVRSEAATSLGRLEYKKAAIALSDLLNDADKEVRKKAIWALGKIKADNIVDTLKEQFAKDNENVRAEIAFAFSMIESEQALEILAQIIGDKKETIDVRYNSILGLKKGNGIIFKTLFNLLRDPNEPTKLKDCVLYALKEIDKSWSFITIDCFAITGPLKETTDSEGKSDLMRAIDKWAIDTNKFDDVKSLIIKGADVNARDKAGKTPLMQTTFYGMLEPTVMLIAKGADINAKDNNSNSVLRYAQVWGRPVIAKLLMDLDAKESG